MVLDCNMRIKLAWLQQFKMYDVRRQHRASQSTLNSCSPSTASSAPNIVPLRASINHSHISRRGHTSIGMILSSL